MRPWLKLAGLSVLALVVAQLLVRSPGSGPAPGQASPPLALARLDGSGLDLASLRGKVVLVNFWATWCGPCRRELPDLVAFWRANRDQCFELLGVVEESARQDVAEAARSIPYPILLDAGAEAAQAWSVRGYPTSYLLDAEGQVRLAFSGPVTRAELERAVEPLRPAGCVAR